MRDPGALVLIALAASAGLVGTAGAADLTPSLSSLGFTSRQMGVPVEGRFKRFDAKLNFDPKKPETGQVSFSIALASVSLGAPELESELAKAAWFDSKKLPLATFQSSAIKAKGGNQFEVVGKLTIKGQSRDIFVPIQLAQAGSVTEASGGFMLKRLEFKIGDGEWADTSLVANEVQVKFKLVFSGVAPL